MVGLHRELTDLPSRAGAVHGPIRSASTDSIRGSGRDITVQAESSSEARRTVMDMIPKAVVTGVSRVKIGNPDDL